MTWSPSFSEGRLPGRLWKGEGRPWDHAPPTGKATNWTGTESLAGFGNLSFAMYPGGRVVMTDASNTVEGTWEKDGNKYTLAFFDRTVIYTGVVTMAPPCRARRRGQGRTEPEEDVEMVEMVKLQAAG